MNRSTPALAIVVPCFNEEEALSSTILSTRHTLDTLISNGHVSKDSYILFVDDGSNDHTWDIIEKAHNDDPSISGLRLSRNYGHQNALMAGMLHARNNSDCCISIDADLQQDISKLEDFLLHYKSGSDIVFGIRHDRKSDGFFKKWTALGFYGLMTKLGTPLIRNHADYRLTSREALDALAQYGERNIFLRGIFADMGLKTSNVYFETKERTQGESKYTIRKMILFALHGITSFSIAPLRFITFLGIIIFTLSTIMGFYIMARSLIIGDTVPGWASTTLPIYFLGGLQTLCIGILGEYIGNIYMETKSRPRYLIQKVLEKKS